MKRTLTTLLSVAAASLFALAAPGEAQAQSLTLTLNPVGAPVNVADAAGTWQHEGGQVICPDGTTHVANYAIHRRLTLSGTNPQNTSMLTLTLFFVGTSPTQNITLQGTHDFGTGAYIGSVSAASSAFASVRRQGFAGSTVSDTLTIGRLGRAAVTPARNALA